MTHTEEQHAPGRDRIDDRAGFLPDMEKGRHKSTKKATREENRVRVRYVVLMLCEGRSKKYIQDLFAKLYGLKHRQTERYIQSARTAMSSEINVPTSELLARSYAFYMTVLQDGHAHWREKIKARQCADQLLGLTADQRPKTPLRDENADAISKGLDLLPPEKVIAFGELIQEMRAAAQAAAGK